MYVFVTKRFFCSCVNYLWKETYLCWSEKWEEIRQPNRAGQNIFFCKKSKWIGWIVHSEHNHIPVCKNRVQLTITTQAVNSVRKVRLDWVLFVLTCPRWLECPLTLLYTSRARWHSVSSVVIIIQSKSCPNVCQLQSATLGSVRVV